MHTCYDHPEKHITEKLVPVIRFRKYKALVAHWGSSGGSLVATPDCETAVLVSNPVISPDYSGLPVLRWAGIWEWYFTACCYLWGGRREYKYITQNN
jgi:hypothetical protein